MPKHIDDFIKERCQRIAYENPGKTKWAIYQLVLKEFGDRKDGGESPSYKTISNWIDKYPPGDLPPDEPIDIWKNKWSNPDRFRTLLVLLDTARSVCRDHGVENFEGLTDRVASWACKLRPFFDLESRLDCLVLLDFARMFAQEERFAKAMNKPMSSDGDVSRHLMAWHWRDGEPELSHKILDRERETTGLIPLWTQGEENIAWSLSCDFNFSNSNFSNSGRRYRNVSTTSEVANHGNS